MSKNGLLGVIVVLVVIIAGVFWLNADVSKKQNESLGGIASTGSVELSDDNPTFDHWGKNFPEYRDMYLEVETDKPFETDFGGNLAYSKLIRYPQLTQLWAGYAFAVDANEERGHFFIQEDQMKTARNNKDFLNAHGAAGFGGQPTACMHCHSGWTPWLVKNVGGKADGVYSDADFVDGAAVKFYSTKYWTMIKNVPAMNGMAEGSPEHAGLHGGKRMGVTCADCHNPVDMQLRVTRPGLIYALTKLRGGYEQDPVTGIKADRSEMRTLVCAQCHVEYYFKPTGAKVKVQGETIADDPTKKWWNGTQKTYDEYEFLRDGNQFKEIEVDGINLVYPWSKWKKGEPFRIEMFDEHYDEVKDAFPSDWSHKLTKAPMLKIQHPEYELYSGSVHAANGVSCADCHMPYMRKGAKKVTQHNITSPLANINAACKSCHTQSEQYLKGQIKDIQNAVAFDLRSVEYATVSLIHDIKFIREALGAKAEYQTDGKADDKKISARLAEVLDLHRRGQMRGDFVGAENSTGFHNPREAQRMLLQALEMARVGQTKLVQIAAAEGITGFTPNDFTFEDIQKFNPGEIVYKVDVGEHKAGERYYEEPHVNGAPSQGLLELDKNTKPFNYSAMDHR